MSAREPRQFRLIDDRWTTIRHVVESLAIVAAGAWAFYTFIYQERIKPAQEPAALGQSIAISRLGRDARRDFLGFTISLQNTGKTEIDIAADAFTVWGYRYGAHATTTFRKTASEQTFMRNLPVAGRRVIEAYSELRDASIGGHRGNHIILEPGETQTIVDVLVVTRGMYDLIHAEIAAVPIKTPVRRRVRVTVVREPSGAFRLHPDNTVDEDNTSSDFALVP